MMRQSEKKNAISTTIIIVLLVIIAATLAIIAVLLASPYRDRFKQKIQDILYTKRIAYTHNNIYTDGVEGILTDMQARLGLPEELYITNAATIDYAPDGTVTDIYMFLYGRNEHGKVGTWLVSYSASSELKNRLCSDPADSTSATSPAGTAASGARSEDSKEYLTVYLSSRLGDSTTQNGFRDTMLLDPMIRLLQVMDLQERSELYVDATGADSLQLIYWGCRSMDVNERSYVVEEDGTLSSAAYYGIQTGEPNRTYAGYEISLHDPDDAEGVPARYFAQWITSQDFVDPAVAEATQRETEAEAQRTDEGLWGTGYMDNTDGTMYCYLSDDIGYRLVVTDAAAGSRFYQLESTSDGGKSWETRNTDPFLGMIGVVSGMEFEDEIHGTIYLGSPSGGIKETCRTEDGGVTFTAIE